MASSLARSMTRIFTTADRLNVRATYGDLISVHNAAVDELDAGQVKNAWALLNEALGMALRQAWIDLSGKENTGITDRKRLLEKLRSSTVIDNWTYAVVETALRAHPRSRYSLRQCDLLAAIVRVFVFDEPAKAIKRVDATVDVAKSIEVHVEDVGPKLVPTAATPAEPAAEPEPAALQTARKSTARYEPTEAEIERECRKLLLSKYPSFPLRDDEFRSPHWREHEARLAAIGVS